MTDPTPAEALKACPLCACESMRAGFIRATDQVKWQFIECANCGCRVEGATKELVTALWNTRPAADAGEVRSGLIAELRNPWEQIDGDPRGKLPFWAGDLLSRAADALETQAPVETVPRPQFHEVLKLMRETMESHPFWRKVVGTPAVNDLPVRAAAVACDLLAAKSSHPFPDREAIARELANHLSSGVTGTGGGDMDDCDDFDSKHPMHRQAYFDAADAVLRLSLTPSPAGEG